VHGLRETQRTGLAHKITGTRLFNSPSPPSDTHALPVKWQ